MKKLINLTPHEIVLNDGTKIPASGAIARCNSQSSERDEDLVSNVTFGTVEGLPAPEDGVLYITSMVVAQKAQRADVVSPDTNSKECVRQDGKIVSVPGYCRWC